MLTRNINAPFYVNVNRIMFDFRLVTALKDAVGYEVFGRVGVLRC